MPMTEEDLKELCKHIEKELPEIEDGALEVDLTSLKRQIEVIRYNPLVFESILEQYDVNYDILGTPMEDVPKYVADDRPLVKYLMKWRCERGK